MRIFTKVFWVDAGERVGKAFIGGVLTAFTAANISAGIAAFGAQDYSELEKLGASALLAGGYAVASLVLSLLSGLKTQTASWSTTVAQTAVVPAPVHDAEHAV